MQVAPDAVPRMKWLALQSAHSPARALCRPASVGGGTYEARARPGAVATIRNVDTVITGHIPTSTWNDFREYADFTRDFVGYAESARKAGKSVDQAAAEYRIPGRYTGYVASVASNVSPAANLTLAYDELSR